MQSHSTILHVSPGILPPWDTVKTLPFSPGKVSRLTLNVAFLWLGLEFAEFRTTS